MFHKGGLMSEFFFHFGSNLKNKGATTIPEHYLPKNEDPQGSDLAPFF